MRGSHASEFDSPPFSLPEPFLLCKIPHFAPAHFFPGYDKRSCQVEHISQFRQERMFSLADIKQKLRDCPRKAIAPLCDHMEYPWCQSTRNGRRIRPTSTFLLAGSPFLYNHRIYFCTPPAQSGEYNLNSPLRKRYSECCPAPNNKGHLPSLHHPSFPASIDSLMLLGHRFCYSLFYKGN